MKHLSALIVLCVALCGCLVSSSNRETISGNYVAPATFDQIESGKTSAAWVKATLGEPTSVTGANDGTEIWKYNYTERKEGSGAIFLIFGGHNVKEKSRTAFVELKDGIVTKKWRG